MANTCAKLVGSSIHVPDNCGKLTITDMIMNWLAVRSILEWLLGFLGFQIPGRLQSWVFEVNGSDNVTIPNYDQVNNTIVFAIPTGNFAYSFYTVFINGLERPGGTIDGGADAFTLEYAWKVENDGTNYILTFLDEDLNPIILGGEGKPDTVVIKFRPMLTIGTYFCTTNGTANQTVEGCKC